jgi:pyrroline-5-carboxylate reductase
MGLMPAFQGWIALDLIDDRCNLYGIHFDISRSQIVQTVIGMIIMINQKSNTGLKLLIE